MDENIHKAFWLSFQGLPEYGYDEKAKYVETFANIIWTFKLVKDKEKYHDNLLST